MLLKVQSETTDYETCKETREHQEKSRKQNSLSSPDGKLSKDFEADRINIIKELKDILKQKYYYDEPSNRGLSV